ncbi:hypothetical protein CV044_00690 [Achromobacter ruhlandii]|nr:hypothetical protein CV044_00690 [Achromobacter ruhlandii]
MGGGRRQDHHPAGAALHRRAPLADPEGKGPHAPPLRGSLPPKGAFLPWGGPAAKIAPTLRRCAVAAPPKGAFLPWGGPAEEIAPTLRRCAVAAPQGGVFALGRPGGKKTAVAGVMPAAAAADPP